MQVTDYVKRREELEDGARRCRRHVSEEPNKI